MEKKAIIIIGLGNSPIQYQYTRHNIGKDFLFFLYNKNLFTENKLYYSYNDTIENQDCSFIIPNLYMNNSGDIFKDNYLKKIAMQDNTKIIIIHDDLEVPFGKYKLRNNKDRSERGHNGNRSINQSLKSLLKEKYTQPYYLSIGIGRPANEEIDTWVLKKFNSLEITALESTIYPSIKNELSHILESL